MNEDIRRAWDVAWSNPDKAQPIGDAVVCDDCCRDYTNGADSGGFIFESKAEKAVSDILSLQ